MNPQIITTDGEELVVLPRRDYDVLLARLGDEGAEDRMTVRLVEESWRRIASGEEGFVQADASGRPVLGGPDSFDVIILHLNAEGLEDQPAGTRGSGRDHPGIPERYRSPAEDADGGRLDGACEGNGAAPTQRVSQAAQRRSTTAARFAYLDRQLRHLPHSWHSGTMR